MPEANASMIDSSTLLISPKSRKTNRPSSASMMLPSWGSACTRPVRTRPAVTASHDMYVIRMASSGVRSERCLPYTHSIAIALRVVSSGRFCGTST